MQYDSQTWFLKQARQLTVGMHPGAVCMSRSTWFSKLFQFISICATPLSPGLLAQMTNALSVGFKSRLFLELVQTIASQSPLHIAQPVCPNKEARPRPCIERPKSLPKRGLIAPGVGPGCPHVRHVCLVVGSHMSVSGHFVGAFWGPTNAPHRPDEHTVLRDG